MTNFSYVCPYCNHDVVIDTDHYDKYQCLSENRVCTDGSINTEVEYIVCPNPACRKRTIKLSMFKGTRKSYGWSKEETIKELTLKPENIAKSFPEYIPKSIIEDYNEACLIKDLSPKAAATLLRRCLQGIIRDFFQISKSRLIDEIKAIEDKIDEDTKLAIDTVRKMGNIGAHMEKDINTIIEVEQEEVSLLIWLIETLINDLYIARNNKEKKLEEIRQLKINKKDNK